MWYLRNGRERRQSAQVLAMLDLSIARLNPERSETDLALDARPLLFGLNVYFGREGDDRFRMIASDALIDHVRVLKQKGLLPQLSRVIGSEPPSPPGAAMLAAMHLAGAKGRPSQMVPEIRAKLDVLLAMLNEQAGAKP